MSLNVKVRSVIKNGFTLVETVVGIVVLSIAFSILTTLIFPLVEDSADQFHQIRAAELAQSLFNEIQGRSFDENSDRNGGYWRCGEDQNDDGSVDGDELCTLSDSLGYEDSEEREGYDDVDDYHGLNLSGEDIENSLGEKLGDLYAGFEVNVTVINDSNYDGSYVSTDDNNYSAKLVTVIVTTPKGFAFEFSSYRTNF